MTVQGEKLWRAEDRICRQLLIYSAGKYHWKNITRLRLIIQDTFLPSKEENNGDGQQRLEFKVSARQRLPTTDKSHLNSKWVSLKPCSSENTGFGIDLPVNSLFYREFKLPSSAHSFFGWGSSHASDCVSITYIQAFTKGNDFTKLGCCHWHYAREEGEKLHLDHSRLHWADLVYLAITCSDG